MRKIKYLLLIFMLVVLSGCSHKLKAVDTDNTAPIVLDIKQCSYEINKYGGVIVNAFIDIINNTDDDVMYVKYNVIFYDKDMNEIYNVDQSFSWDDVPLKAGTTDSVERTLLHMGLDTKPKFVSMTLEKYETTDERPVSVLPSIGESLKDYINRKSLVNLDESIPVAIQFGIDKSGCEWIATFEEVQDIEYFMSLFSSISIKEETNESVTDNYNYIIFTLEDGSSIFISLNLYSLEISNNNNYHYYVLNNLSPLWKYAEDNSVEVTYDE